MIVDKQPNPFRSSSNDLPLLYTSWKATQLFSLRGSRFSCFRHLSDLVMMICVSTTLILILLLICCYWTAWFQHQHACHLDIVFQILNLSSKIQKVSLPRNFIAGMLTMPTFLSFCWITGFKDCLARSNAAKFSLVRETISSIFVSHSFAKIKEDNKKIEMYSLYFVYFMYHLLSILQCSDPLLNIIITRTIASVNR